MWEKDKRMSPLQSLLDSTLFASSDTYFIERNVGHSVKAHGRRPESVAEDLIVDLIDAMSMISEVRSEFAESRARREWEVAKSDRKERGVSMESGERAR